MKNITVSCLLMAFVCLFAARPAPAADFAQKWVRMTANLSRAGDDDNLIALMREARSSGCTHVLLSEGNTSNLARMDDAYSASVSKVLAAAKELGIVVVPSIFPSGYGGGFLQHDRNLAAGVPARDVPFVVKDGVASPDPSTVPALANAGFDEADGDALSGWRRQGYPGVHSFADREVKRSGAASLRIAALDKLPEEARGSVRAYQTVKVKPFQYCRLRLWVKSDGVEAEGEDYLVITSSGGKRRNTYQNLHVRTTQDWTEHVITFNTFEGDEIELSVGVGAATAGAIWFDDITVEPAGLLNVLRRPLTPFVVKSADGSVVYEESKDFEPVADPKLNANDVRHDTPGIVIAKDSRIKDGDTLLVSYFHPMVIYNSQVTLSLTDPKTFDLMDEQMRLMAEKWPTEGYFISCDEIRVGAWEPLPDGVTLTPGQQLAGYISRGVAIVRNHAPEADIYAWSDMFTPYHNARPFEVKGYYYLVNGNWDGAWDGLPSDVIIANWYSPDSKNIKWFADRGHKQILCGYYDSPMRPNIEKWMEVSKDAPGIVGIMYTTWRRNYSDMKEFFQLVDTYPAWVEPAAQSTDSAMKEK